jgi:nucleotidyltransferase/DNA polymerase involved in DNA repair
MRVEQLPHMEAEQIRRLRAAGITNCRQLLRACQRPERFQRLETVTGLPSETLSDIMRKAEVSQIRGVGTRTLAHLFEVGVDSLDTLAALKPESLRADLQRVMTRPPNLAVIEDWIVQAGQRAGCSALPPLQPA